jgi:hypothetical protein
MDEAQNNGCEVREVLIRMATSLLTLHAIIEKAKRCF